MLTGLLSLVGYTLQLSAVIILSVISLAATVVMAFAPANSALGASRGKAKPRPSTTTTRRASVDWEIKHGKPVAPGKPRKSRPSAAPGTGRPRRPAKPKACDPRCRSSAGYVEDCDCSCGGASHGADRKGGPRRKVTRNQARGKQLRKEEREHVRRNERQPHGRHRA